MRTIVTKLLMLAAVLSASKNVYAYDFEVDGIYYNIISSTEKTVEVTYRSRNYSYSDNVVIPEQVSYNNDTYSVTSIGDKAFSRCSGLTSVTIPNSVTTIGDYAFYWCSDLASVTIPNSVTTIGDYAFMSSGLISVTIPNSVTSIGRYAFFHEDYRSKLKVVNISDLSAWCKIEFYDCTSNPLYYAHNLYLNGNLVTDLTIPDDIVELEFTFVGCSGLTSVTIPNSVTSIICAFEGCSGLTSVTIPNSVTSIICAFEGCSGLTSVTIPNSVTSIDSAFRGCSGLTSVTIPNSVTTIGDYAFRGCSGLTSVTIPNSVTSIGLAAFSGCSGLTSVTIGESVTTIGNLAFSGCSGLTSVTIPNNVLYVGSSAFANSGVKELTIEVGEETISIEGSAFDSCPIATLNLGRNLSSFYFTKNLKNLKNLTISDNVTSLGNSAFSGCNSLKSVTIGAGVQSIGESAFEETDLTKTIWLPNTPPDGYGAVSSKCNYVANESYTKLSNKTVYPYLSSMFETSGLKYVPVSPSERTCDAIDCSYDNTADIVIGKTVNYKGVEMTLLDVKDYLCYNNDSIKTLSIDGYEGNIGDMAFAGCENIGGIEIPNTVTSIGSGCFQDCSSLTYTIIGSGVKDLPEDCFRGCSSLPEITIPATVEKVGNNVFYGCSSLAKIDIEDRQTELSLGYNSDYSSSDRKPLFSDCPLNSIYIGGDISYAIDSYSGYSPFYRNTSLRTVKITGQETEISENEFYGCTGLTTVELGDDIESIGNYAFSGCSALDSFLFGNSVTTIGEEAFSDCTAMTQLWSRATEPPMCGNQALDDINKWTCELFVPEGSLEAYKAADQWKEFFFFGGIGDAVSDNNVSVATYRDSIEITGATDNAVITIYNTNGQIVYSGADTVINVPSKGIYIVRVSGQTFKVIL